MERTKNILWGLVFIILGVIFGLNGFGITRIPVLFEGWWTLIIIIPCLIGAITEKDKKGNLIGLLIGIILLLNAREIITYDLLVKLTIPAILILIGINFITKKPENEQRENKNNNQKENSKNDTIEVEKVEEKVEEKTK